MRALPITLFLFLLCAGTAHAQQNQDRAGRVEWDGGVSMWGLGDDNDDVHAMYSTRVLYNINDAVAVGGEVEFSDADGDENGIPYDVTLVPIYAEALFRAVNPSIITPYFLIGAGALLGDADAGAGASAGLNEDFAAKTALGWEVDAAENVLVGFEGSYAFTDADISTSGGASSFDIDAHHWQVGTRVKYLF